MTTVKSYILALCLCLSSTLDAVSACCDSMGAQQAAEIIVDKPPCHEGAVDVDFSRINTDMQISESGFCCECNDCLNIPSFIDESYENLIISKVFYQPHNETPLSPTVKSPDDPPIIFS